MTIKCFWQICQKWVWEIACYSCYMGGVGSVLAWVARLRGWCASVGRMLLLLLLLLLLFILKKKMLNDYVWNGKMLQIDLNSYLKEEPDLKSKCCFTLVEPVMPRSWIWLNPDGSGDKYVLICVTLWICLEMRETLRA